MNAMCKFPHSVYHIIAWLLSATWWCHISCYVTSHVSLIWIPMIIQLIFFKVVLFYTNFLGHENIYLCLIAKINALKDELVCAKNYYFSKFCLSSTRNFEGQIKLKICRYLHKCSPMLGNYWETIRCAMVGLDICIIRYMPFKKMFFN